MMKAIHFVQFFQNKNLNIPLSSSLFSCVAVWSKRNMFANYLT